jgi:hypothetical protein
MPVTPGQALSILEGSGSQISGQSVEEGSKVVRLTHLPSLPSGNISGTNFC